MAEPIFGPLAVPGRGSGRPKVDASALLAKRGQVRGGGGLTSDQAKAARDFGRSLSRANTSPKNPFESSGPPGILDQISELVAGAPGGLVNMGIDIAKDVQGIGRTAKDLATGQLGDNPDDYFPFLQGVRHSVGRTVPRVAEFATSLAPGGETPGETEYGQAWKEGRIVPTLAEDAGNIALIGGIASKGLTAAGGQAGRQALADAAAEQTAVRGIPGRLTQAGEKIASAMRPIDEAAATPARVWMLPAKALGKLKVPERLFQAAAESESLGPTIARAQETVGNYRLRKDIREGALLPATAEAHVGQSLIDTMTKPARKIFGKDVDLQHATLLAKAGLAPTLEHVAALRDALPAAKYEELLAQTFGREMTPTPRAVDLALDYTRGTLDPKLAAKVDEGWTFMEKALRDVEQVKLAGAEGGRGMLNPEQLGDQPMPSKVTARMAPLEERAQGLSEDIHGYERPNGEFVPGLAQKAEQARAAIPEVDMGRLFDARAAAAQRRAGAVGREAELAATGAERAAGQAVSAGERASAARVQSLRGATDELARMTEDRYGTPARGSAVEELYRTGEAERRLPSGARVVPDDEFALASKIRDLSGSERMGPVFSTQEAAQRAAGRAEQAAGESTAAQARIGRAAENESGSRLQFGEQWTPPARAAEIEHQRVVRDVRTRVRDQLREQRIYHENRLATAGSVRVPARSSGAEWDKYVEMQEVLGEGSNAQRGRFRNINLAADESGAGRRPLFSRAARQTVDELERVYRDVHGLSEEQAWQAVLDDLREAKRLRSAEDAVIRHGTDDPTVLGAAATPAEEAALRSGTVQEAAARARQADLEERLGAHRAMQGPEPWTMPVEDYAAELGDINRRLRTVDPAQWGPEEFAASRRLEELVPADIMGGRPGVEELHNRLLRLADEAGFETVARQARPGAGVVAREDARATAEEAWRIDQEVKGQAFNEGRPVSARELSRSSLSPDEQRIYDALDRRGQAMSAGDRAEAARQRFGLGQRAAGERAGERVGAASAEERLFGREARRQQARVETLEPKVGAVEERAQRLGEEAVGKPVRFGERRGKRMRDVQNIEREMRVKARRLDWLSDERIPGERARLEKGPKEVAPGKYVPALATGERLVSALGEMRDGLIESTGDASLGPMFDRMMADTPTTMAELQDALRARGLDNPEYIPGTIDEPASAPRGAGRPDQLPRLGRTPSERQKGYGHVPRQMTTVARSLAREMGAIAQNKSAQLITEQFARRGGEVLGDLMAEGKISPEVHQRLQNRQLDRSIDMHAEMERAGYTAWDPTSGDGRVVATREGPDTLYLPNTVMKEYQRWWKPGGGNPLLKGYDYATRGFKHSVLALSPQWNVFNILGNAFMATFGAGENPVTIAKYALEAKRMLERQAETGELTLPPRLFGAGQAAEGVRAFAEGHDPRTPFGKVTNASYALNETVDNIGRSAVFLAKKAKGFTDEQAVHAALKAMGDFSNLSPFERNFVRRAVPFYAWMKHVTQASFHLAVEHPWRVAWLMHIADLWNPQDPNMPDWLRSSIGLGGGMFIPLGAVNPYEGTAGSVFTSPGEWPAQLMRSLNPIPKLAGKAVGINLDRARPVTRPAGTGPADEYGTSIFGLQGLPETLTMAQRMIPQGRLLFDLTHDPVVRYDEGSPVLRRGQTIPLDSASSRWQQALRDMGIPFFPAQVDTKQVGARKAKARSTRAKQKARST